MSLLSPGYFPSRAWPENFWPTVYPFWPVYDEALQNPVSLDIANLLEEEAGLGLIFATNLFIGSEPETPSNTVTIFDTPGRPAQYFYDTTLEYYYPSIQVRVRNSNYVTGWILMNSIKDFLHNKSHFVQGGMSYQSVECSIEPSFLGFDENRRSWFVATFDLQVTP